MQSNASHSSLHCNQAQRVAASRYNAAPLPPVSSKFSAPLISHPLFLRRREEGSVTLCAATSEPLNSATRQPTRQTFQRLPTSALVQRARRSFANFTYLTGAVREGDHPSSWCRAGRVPAEPTVSPTQTLVGRKRKLHRTMSPTSSQILCLALRQARCKICGYKKIREEVTVQNDGFSGSAVTSSGTQWRGNCLNQDQKLHRLVGQ